jgi:CDGSH-type Zn-finger protein/uncharacterized Fe-S cluster protein YjdI
MKEKVRRYTGEKAAVTYDAVRCIHAAECVHGLPEVFDPERKPWILPDQAGPDALLRVVVACPTGALHFERADGGPAESAPEGNTATVAADGPVYVHGDVEMVTHEGEALLTDMRVALCRCGASENKPLCDGAHAKAGFQDSGALGSGPGAPVEGEAAKLKLTALPNGPLLFEGPLTFVGSDGKRMHSQKGALCRCGASENKPFCDGQHGQIGFTSE